MSIRNVRSMRRIRPVLDVVRVGRRLGNVLGFTLPMSGFYVSLQVSPSDQYFTAHVAFVRGVPIGV